MMDASTIWQRFMDVRDYKQQEGFIADWQESVDFYEGRQWPASTERTKNMPKPVFNVSEQIVNHKVSAVMADNIRMVFSPEESGDENDEIVAEVFSKFSDTTWEDLKQAALNEKSLTNGATRGNPILHYFWDDNRYGGKALKFIGNICGEVIDPMNIFPGNPKCPDIEKQPWIIILVRLSTENIKEIARKNNIDKAFIPLIVPDKNNDGYETSAREIRGDDKATVLVMYSKSRETGKARYSMSTKNVVFQPEKEMQMKLYPIATMQWKERSESFFGGDEVSAIIPNQKLINFLMAMQALSAMLTGWPKLIYKTDSLDVSKVTNTPGEMLEDKSPDNNFAVRYLAPPAMPSGTQTIVDNVMGITKNLSGATETNTGEAGMMGRMNATAIMLLQKASSVPLEGIKRRYYQMMEDVGNIWAEMWKGYYITERIINIKDDEGNRKPLPFRGSDFADMPMKLKIDVGPASMWSENLAQTTLDNFLEKQFITPEEYLDLVSPNVAPFKAKLKKIFEKRKAEGQPIGPPQELGQGGPQMPPSESSPPQMNNPLPMG